MIDSHVIYEHKTIKCRNYTEFDQLKFNDEVSKMCRGINYEACSTVNDMWNLWKDSLMLLCDKHAPMKVFRVRNDGDNPWVDNDIIKLMKDRDKKHKLAIDQKNDELFDEYRYLRNSVTEQIKYKKKQHIMSMLDGQNVKESNVWKAVNLVKGNNKSNNSLPVHIKCTDMNKYYATIGDKLAASFSNSDKDEYLWKGGSSIHRFNIEPIKCQQVYEELKKLSDKSKKDVLDMDSRLLHISSGVISDSLTFLFNESIVQGIVPDDWKKARVTPIYKGKGSKSDHGNYRPISVIGFVSKILEKCIQTQLLTYLEKHAFITVDQSAYLKNHSTQTVLHKVTNDWLSAIDEGLINGVCFFDLAKCFNTIDPDILLFKLAKYGIHNTIHGWFKSYLHNRQQCTIINGELSEFELVRVGIPQGSFLGPTLFLLFMNDLPMYVSNVTLFADDTMISASASTFEELINILQTNINSLVFWFKRNKLSVNIDKFCSMLIGSLQRINNYFNRKSLGLKVMGTDLANRSHYTYLGLTIDSCLTWNIAVSNICKKLGSRIAMAQRLMQVLPYTYISTIYYAFIQPYIDYGLSVWGNTSDLNIKKVQRLQSRAARVLTNNFNYEISSHNILKQQKWQNVEKRKEFLTCILMYKCVNNSAPFYLSDDILYTNQVHNYMTRNIANDHLYIPQARTEYFKKSLLYIGPKLWNELPINIRSVTTIDHFKRSLKKWQCD